MTIADRVEIKTTADIQFNETKKSDKCFRLVLDGKKIVAFFESDGFTATGHDLIVGSKPECLAELKTRGIKAVEPTKADIL